MLRNYASLGLLHVNGSIDGTMLLTVIHLLPFIDKLVVSITSNLSVDSPFSVYPSQVCRSVWSYEQQRAAFGATCDANHVRKSRRLVVSD